MLYALVCYMLSRRSRLLILLSDNDCTSSAAITEPSTQFISLILIYFVDVDSRQKRRGPECCGRMRNSTRVVGTATQTRARARARVQSLRLDNASAGERPDGGCCCRIFGELHAKSRGLQIRCFSEMKGCHVKLLCVHLPSGDYCTMSLTVATGYFMV
jgi:hypothetical protein